LRGFTLLGHNGAGKTTLINYLLGFYTNRTQHPYLANLSRFFSPLDTQNCGFAPEAAYIDTELSADEYFSMICSIKRLDISVKELLDSVGLAVDIKKPIKTYSKGMKQRFLLALALAGRPQILILDEPTSGLDPFGAQIIEDLLLGLNKNYRLILSTHNIELAFNLKNEIFILKEGEVVQRGFFDSKEELKESILLHKPKVVL